MASKRNKVDSINPQHYKYGKGIEAIDYIEGVCQGVPGKEAPSVANAIKYISRYRRKNNTKENQKKDIEKAIWYCQRIIKNLEEGE